MNFKIDDQVWFKDQDRDEETLKEIKKLDKMIYNEELKQDGTLR